MQFQPKTEKEIQESRLLPDGEYEFVVKSSEDKVSKKGDDMIAVELRMFAANNRIGSVKDWLSGASWGEAKLNAFCHCVGIEDKYFAGSLEAGDLMGLAGRAKVTTKNDPKFGPQNVVSSYVKLKREAPAKPKVESPASEPAGANADDETPF